ncbi:MAG TPA: YbhB/YbcL family Raf kinase inhibitor-like protein [Pseudolabrys sp.]|nr:YbhB/YbcL family Raf kinase inhibitor-like protein [Pseudolabrys sp.]
MATPPAFELGDVPSGTKRLRFNMTDLNVPTFRHSGSTISYIGNAVSRGAVDYIGPCPPRGERHNYRWTVEALDAADKVLGKGSAEATFPP